VKKFYYKDCFKSVWGKSYILSSNKEFILITKLDPFGYENFTIFYFKNGFCHIEFQCKTSIVQCKPSIVENSLFTKSCFLRKRNDYKKYLLNFENSECIDVKDLVFREEISRKEIRKEFENFFNFLLFNPILLSGKKASREDLWEQLIVGFEELK